MRRINRLLLAASLGLVAGGIIISSAQGADSGARIPARGHWLERVQHKLRLSDEQVDKIKREFKAEKGPLKDLISRLHDARVDLRETIHAQAANESTVRAASAKVAAVEADLAVERLKLYQRISPILTSEQLETLAEFQDRLDQAIERAIDSASNRTTSE